MTEEHIFDFDYVDVKSTKGEQSRSGLKGFLKTPLEPEEMKAYGTSKPKRIVIKAKISGS